MRFVKCAKKSIIFLCLASLLTLLIFVSFNRPVKVHAEVLTATAIGVGALAAFLGSYFVASGVDLDFNNFDDSTIGAFFNGIVSDYQNSTSTVNTYFNENGEYIGTEEDLQFILSDESMGYWSMGKDLNAWAESVKDWFVTEKGLTSESVTSLSNTSVISIEGSTYPLAPYSGDIGFAGGFTMNPYQSDSLLQYDGDYFSISFENFSLSAVFSLQSTDQFRIAYVVNGSYNAESFTYGYDLHREVLSQNGNHPIYAGFWYRNGNVNNLYFGIFRAGYDYSWALSKWWQVSNTESSVTSMSAEGALTDGYEDFQNALDQGLSDQADNENAVVGVGVGSVGDALTVEQVKEAILAALAENTLSGSLSGVYEDQAAASDELEGEKEFSPSYPEGWVVVNGLEDFFPFCIPFDLYALICLFNAEPEAPQFDLHFDFAGIMPEQDITLDFSQFEFLARIVRVLVVIGFVIFLIIKTRDMIRG